MLTKEYIKQRLIESLDEAYQTSHFITRVKNRINGIYDIRINKEIFQGEDPEALKTKIITKIKELLHTRVHRMTNHTFPSSNYDTIVAKLGKMFVKKNGVQYPLTVLSRYMEDDKEEEKIGNMFISQVYTLGI
jgi:hypothetical protein